MKTYICEKCNKIFNKKCNYHDHLKRKTSCEKNNKNTNFNRLNQNAEKINSAENGLKLTAENLKLTENDFEMTAENFELTENDFEMTAENFDFAEKSCKNIIKNNKFAENNNNKFAEKSNSASKKDLIQTNKKIIFSIENNQCVYCHKKFTRKNNITQHIKNNCKIKKEREKEKETIFKNLKNEKIEKENIILKLKELEKEKQNMQKMLESEKNNNNVIEKKLNKIENTMTKKIEKLEKKIEKQSKIINQSDNSVKNINDNSQHLYLVGYNKENLYNLDKKKVIANLNRGYQAPVEMTRLIHFDEDHPENHNIYIPKINEKYGMVFKNDIWKLMDKNDLVDDIYESKRSYIVENLEKFIKEIDPKRLKSLQRFLDSEDNEISIINTKEEIKNLLYENRKMVMEHKNEVENINKKRKKLNVIMKKIKTIE
jgi:hypothetical protein